MKNALLAAALIYLTVSPGALAQSDSNQMTIYKSPSCGCCAAWASAMKKSGYSIKLVDSYDLTAVKKKWGLAPDHQGCHTAVMGGYVLEGHVPLEAVRRLMAEKPQIKGLAVPGMPAGSLGMGYDPKARYDVLALPKEANRSATVFYEAGK